MMYKDAKQWCRANGHDGPLSPARVLQSSLQHGGELLGMSEIM